jgi:hypothetical protein
MSTSLVRVLIVGPPTFSTHDISKKLAGAGWGSHSVSSVHEAETVLKTIRFKVVLCAERLPDGTGYELAPLIGRQAGTLFIGVSLSETCLWLPVVERGARTLGRRAMNPTMLESELNQLLRPSRVAETAWRTEAATPSVAVNTFPEFVKPGELAAGPLKSDLLASILHDNSVLRGRNIVGSKPRVEIPPRRKSSEAGPVSFKRLETAASGHAEPSTGAFGKIWRG